MKSTINRKILALVINGFLFLPLGCTTTIDDQAFCETKIDSSAPDWVKNNFQCVTVTVNGSQMSINTTGLPPYKSYYYGSSSPLYEDIPAGNTANNNTISTLNATLTVSTSPTSPSDANGTTETGLGIIGISSNGVTIFSNDAAPGDTLANEAVTFDAGEGHPQGTGIYHYHIEPVKISNSDGAIIGIAKDGFPIYGKKEKDGSDVSGLNANTHGHFHSNDDFPGGTYHYHITTDQTAGIETILGDKFLGTEGTVTN